MEREAVAKWLAAVDQAWRLQREVSPAQAVIALVEAKVREALQACNSSRTLAEEDAIVARVMGRSPGL